MVCFQNGELVGRERETTTAPFNLGVGHFTTFRARRFSESFHVLRYERHIDRIADAQRRCQGLHIQNPTEEEITSAVSAALAEFGAQNEGDARVRITFWQHMWEVRVIPCTPFALHASETVIPFSGERSIPEIKSCSAFVCMQAQAYAKERGFTEGLLVDRDGLVRESAWGNIGWITNEQTFVFTNDGILPGVTESVVRNLIQTDSNVSITEAVVTVADLIASAREIFVTSSVRGVVAVTAVGDHHLSGGTQVARLQEKYWDDHFWQAPTATVFAEGERLMNKI